MFYLTVGRRFLFKEALQLEQELWPITINRSTLRWSHQVVHRKHTVNEQEVLNSRLPSIASYVPHYAKEALKEESNL